MPDFKAIEAARARCLNAKLETVTQEDLDAAYLLAVAWGEGTWPQRCEQRAFVEGAKWWEWESTGATMFGEDRNIAEAEAVRRYGEPKDDATTKGQQCR